MFYIAKAGWIAVNHHFCFLLFQIGYYSIYIIVQSVPFRKNVLVQSLIQERYAGWPNRQRWPCFGSKSFWKREEQ